MATAGYNRVDYMTSQSDLEPLLQTVRRKSWLHRLCCFLLCVKPSIDDYDSSSLGDGFEDIDGHYSRDDPNSSNASESRILDDPLGEAVGRIQFGVRYDDNRKTLAIKIIRAENLVPLAQGRICNPYVKVVLLPNKRNKLFTSRNGKTLDPVWNEFLNFEGISYNMLQIQSKLFLQVLHYDTFSKDEPLGETYVTLSDLNLLEGQILWKNLMPSKRTDNLGRVYLQLCYNSITSRLEVKVVKALHLKTKNLKSLPNPYIKIWLMYDGHRVEKKKTSTINKNENPKYNETFAFLVPLERIRAASLTISAMNYDQFGRNDIIGQIRLGKGTGPVEVQHWMEMFSKPREYVGQWHALKNLRCLNSN